MKTYIGFRQPDGTATVSILEHGELRPLPHPQDPIYLDEFEWGYAGTGPQALARALARDACHLTTGLPDLHYRLIAKLPYPPGYNRRGPCWKITEDEVRRCAQGHDFKVEVHSA